MKEVIFKLTRDIKLEDFNKINHEKLNFLDHINLDNRKPKEFTPGDKIWKKLSEFEEPCFSVYSEDDFSKKCIEEAFDVVEEKDDYDTRFYHKCRARSYVTRTADIMIYGLLKLLRRNRRIIINPDYGSDLVNSADIYKYLVLLRSGELYISEDYLNINIEIPLAELLKQAYEDMLIHEDKMYNYEVICAVSRALGIRKSDFSMAYGTESDYSDESGIDE